MNTRNHFTNIIINRQKQAKTPRPIDPFRVRILLVINLQFKIEDKHIGEMTHHLRSKYPSLAYLKIDFESPKILEYTSSYKGVLTMLEHKDYQKILEKGKLYFIDPKTRISFEIIVLDKMTTQNERKIYLTNIPKKVSNNQLRSIFSKFGEVIKAFIINPNFKSGNASFQGRKSTKFAMRAGIVLYKNKHSVEDAIRAGIVQYKGSKIIVNQFRAKKDKKIIKSKKEELLKYRQNSNFNYPKFFDRRNLSSSSKFQAQVSKIPYMGSQYDPRRGSIRQDLRLRGEAQIFDLRQPGLRTHKYIERISKLNSFRSNHYCENLRMNHSKF